MEAILIVIGIVVVAVLVWKSKRGIQVGMWVRLVDEDGSRVGKVKRVRGTPSRSRSRERMDTEGDRAMLIDVLRFVNELPAKLADADVFLGAEADRVIAEAEEMLERMQRPSILNDPVTITEDELKAMGWKRLEETFRPRRVYYCPHATDLQVEFIEGDPIVQIEASHDGWVLPDGVKTIDDLVALARYLTGRSA